MEIKAHAGAGTSVRKIHIYALGVFVLGVSHGWLRSAFSGAVSLAIVTCYLVLLRLAAEKWGK